MILNRFLYLMKYNLLLTSLILLFFFSSCIQKPAENFSPASWRTEALIEWESFRFGAFIHFNDNTCIGKELSKNSDPEIFNPVNLNFDTLSSISISMFRTVVLSATFRPIF